MKQPVFVGLRMLTKWLAQEAIKPKYPTLDKLMGPMPTAPSPRPETPALSAKHTPGTTFSTPQVIPYSRSLIIKNVEALPKGTGAKYLVAIRGQDDDLVAKNWARVMPHNIPAGTVIIDMIPPKPLATQNAEDIEMPPPAEPKPKIGTSCIPCSVNHLSTCSGLLAEALRFARTDGLTSSEVVDRLGLCQDEINAMERVDLRAENIVQLEPQERALAQELLVKTRSLRHKLEHLDNATGLEELTAGVQHLRAEVGKKWLVNKFQTLPPEQQAKVKQAVLQKLSPPQN